MPAHRQGVPGTPSSGVSEILRDDLHSQHFAELPLTQKLKRCETIRAHAKGVVLCERACFCLLNAFYAPSKPPPPLLRTLLKTSVSIETLTRRLLRTLLRSTSFKEPFKNPSKKRAVA